MSHTLSINGFGLTSGQPHRFTFVNGNTVDGVVTRTGSNVVEIRTTDGEYRDLGQCFITKIEPVPAEATGDVAQRSRQTAWVLIDMFGPEKAYRITSDTLAGMVDDKARAAQFRLIMFTVNAIRIVKDAREDVAHILRLTNGDRAKVREWIEDACHRYPAGSPEEHSAMAKRYWLDKL